MVLVGVLIDRRGVRGLGFVWVAFRGIMFRILEFKTRSVLEAITSFGDWVAKPGWQVQSSSLSKSLASLSSPEAGGCQSTCTASIPWEERDS
jgi:hypothetical protein